MEIRILDTETLDCKTTWPGCEAVPRVGDEIQLWDMNKYSVEKVSWSTTKDRAARIVEVWVRRKED